MLGNLIERLNTRERWLAVGVFAVLAWVIFDTLAWQPSQKRIKKFGIENQALQDEIRQLGAVADATETALKDDPNTVLDRRRRELVAATRELRDSIEATAGKRMSTSRDTPSAVEFLLRSQPALVLEQLKKGAPEAVIDSSTAPAPGTSRTNSALPPLRAEQALKKHPVDIELRGSYGDIAGFIGDLARAHPDVAFESFRLETRGYPVNALRLRLAIFSYDGTLVNE